MGDRVEKYNYTPVQDHWSHDIDDPDAFVGKVISRSSIDLDHHRRERLHQFLLIELWQLSLRWNPPAKYKHKGFDGFARPILSLRVIDWERSAEEGGRTKWQFKGHTHERARPGFVSLDERPDSAEPSSTVDSEGSGLQDLIGLLGERGSHHPRPEHTMGKRAHGKAA